MKYQPFSINELKDKVLSIKGAKETAENLDMLDDSECRVLLKFMLNHKSLNDSYTPPNNFSPSNKDDPHGNMYNGERAKLTMGGLTDDQMASALFMDGDSTNPFVSKIALLTAGKERIRWLSRSMITLLKLVLILRSRLAKYENVEVTAPFNELDKFVDTEYHRYVRAIMGK